MLAKVKLALRLKTNAFDEELSDLINAAKADLSLSGVYDIQEDDPLIGRAIIVYCQAHFGANADSDRYQQSYTMLKEHLALSLKYNGGGMD